MPKKPLKPGTKPFVVFEAGCGREPKGLFRQARKARREGKDHRLFIGSDRNLGKLWGRFQNWENRLRRRKLTNIRVTDNCSIRELAIFPAESIDVIFESYVLNSLGKESSCLAPGMHCGEVFFRAAKRALAPGGRLVMVQNKPDIAFIKDLAGHFGFSFAAFEIPDNVARKSPAKWIRKRATLKRRTERINSDIRDGDLTEAQITKEIKSGKIKSRDEYTKPTLMVLRKSRKRSDAKELFDMLDEMPPEAALLLDAVLSAMGQGSGR